MLFYRQNHNGASFTQMIDTLNVSVSSSFSYFRFICLGVFRDPGNYFESIRIKHGPEVIKLFSCSTQLRLKFILLINVKIVKIRGILWFKTPKLVIYPAYKC